MNNNRPRFLKAVLFNNNLAEVGGSVIQSKCLTVQDYHYHCYRERNEKGEPYGGFLSEYLTFSIILSDPYASKYFYQCMDRNEYLPFSFIFNASFNDNERLKNYDDALIVYGCVTNVEEKFWDGDAGGEEQLLLHVKMLLSSMIFVGKESVQFLEITKN